MERFVEMDCIYTWSFSIVFAKEFKQFPKDQQDKILDFIDRYEENGLVTPDTFNKYEGKISHSWRGLEKTDKNSRYAYENNLWHYHIGIQYINTPSNYKTSDWVLHFQWIYGENHINIVDIYRHYIIDGKFYLPPVTNLKTIS
ncbi:hypothetical protein [Photorhabdus stackebrandtii]|nr:hypothetical protein [Photorhabdus stackebrandtii]